MRTTTIRISQSSHRILQEISRRDKKSMQAVLEQAIEAYRRQCFLKGVTDDFAALRENDPEWQAEKAERSEWDPPWPMVKRALEVIAETLEVMADRKLMEKLRQSLREVEAGDTIPWKDAKQELSK